jgi:transposase InsO family protein
MTRQSVREYAASVRQRYQAAGKKAKKGILDEFCASTGMHRKAAIRLLNKVERPRSKSPGRPRRYGPEILAPLAEVWESGDRMCGKLLQPVLPDLVDALERHGELMLPAKVKHSLLGMSASTIDRRLERYRRAGLRQPKLKKPGSTGLKAQVPIRTWSEWKGVPVGSVQADLVLHCGDSTEGFYLTTLCVIDVATGWTELQPVWGMSQTAVIASLHMLSRRLPFKLRELHTDNGSEFLNHKLLAWCHREEVRFSRGRSYRKNDQAYVEQKNWQTVRRLVGYDRLASKEALSLLQQLYSCLRLQANFFRPVRKLIGKQRQGAKVVKHYDEPRTPYQRLLAIGTLSEEDRASLETAYLKINPAALRQRIDQVQRKLWTLAREQRRIANVG